MKKLHRTKIASEIAKIGGKFFRVSFIKKNGELRDMVCQRGRRLTSSKRPSAEQENTSYLLVTDVKLAAKGRQAGLSGDELLRYSYRLINLSTIIEIHMLGITYQIVD